MANPYINQILSDYDNIRRVNHQRLEQRTIHIYEKIPKYKELSSEVVSLSMKQARDLILSPNDTTSHKNLSSQLELIAQQKQELLESNGYPSNYLDKIFTCTNCEDTGYTPANLKCFCMEEKVFNCEVQQSSLVNKLEVESFETFNFDYYHSGTGSDKDEENLRKITAAYNMCLKFVSDFDQCFDNLLLTGSTGVGKTFLTNCIAQEIIKKKKKVAYYSAVDFFNEIANTTFDKDLSSANKKRHLNHIYKCDLLIIDDLGTETITAAHESNLFNCINERLLGEKPTIISTNLSPDNINERYKNRIFSRLLGEYDVLQIPGTDIRIQKRLQRKNLK